MSNTFHSTPRPLPYDADPRYFRSRRDLLFSRRDKGSSHSLEEAEPLRSDADVESDSFSVDGSKWTNKLGGDSKKRSLNPFGELLSQRQWLLVLKVYITSDDEDVCPTCLEEYTSRESEDCYKVFSSFSPQLHL